MKICRVVEMSVLAVVLLVMASGVFFISNKHDLMENGCANVSYQKNIVKEEGCNIISVEDSNVNTKETYMANYNDTFATAGQGGSSSVVLDAASGKVLLGENENVRLPMASTTKIITAIVAMENGNLEDYVVIDKKAVGVEGSSIYLKEGQKWKLKDLLYGLMLRSGNDSAEMIAMYIGGGSRDNFIDMMNKKVSDLGLKNTNLTNPSGLHDDNHYTSALDLAKITAVGYGNIEFVKIVSTKSHITDTIFESDGKETKCQFFNKNKMLSLLDNANGVKTGYTKKSGRCLVSGLKKGNVQLVSVVLNIPDMWNYSKYLLEKSINQYEKIEVAKAGDTVGYINLKHSLKGYYPVQCENDIVVYVNKNEQKEIKYNFIQNKNIFAAPLKKDTFAGILEIYNGKQLIFREKAYNMIEIQNLYGEVRQQPLF